MVMFYQNDITFIRSTAPINLFYWILLLGKHVQVYEYRYVSLLAEELSVHIRKKNSPAFS